MPKVLEQKFRNQKKNIVKAKFWHSARRRVEGLIAIIVLINKLCWKIVSLVNSTLNIWLEYQNFKTKKNKNHLFFLQIIKKTKPELTLSY